MRIPYLSGLVDRTRNRTRFLFSSGRVPKPIPGPWTLRAVVRDEGAAERDRRPRPEGEATPPTPPPSTPPAGPPAS